MSMKFENMVRCNNCMKVFHENEIIYNEREDKEFCPYCGVSGCLMDIKEMEGNKMKKNYVLIECIEREINLPEFFETEEQAYNVMAQRVADILKIQVEDIETYDGDEVGISKSCAWITDYHHLNYDWKIFKVESSDNNVTCNYI